MDLATKVLIAILGTIAIVMYFLPSFVAGVRKTKHQVAIFVLNLLTGWTFFGWVGAIVWAFADEKL
jgi:hypothetical protein